MRYLGKTYSNSWHIKYARLREDHYNDDVLSSPLTPMMQDQQEAQPDRRKSLIQNLATFATTATNPLAEQENNMSQPMDHYAPMDIYQCVLSRPWDQVDETFSKAMQHFVNGEYTKAHDLFLIYSNQDAKSNYFLDVCFQIIMSLKDKLHLLNCEVALNDPHIMKYFAAFCDMEKSLENVEFMEKVGFAIFLIV